MTTKIKPELSSKNKYWIERHRYYELKHFCLQYPIWVEAFSSIDSIYRSSDMSVLVRTNAIISPTEKCAEARMYYKERIDMVNDAIKKTTDDIYLTWYIVKGVTEGLSYNTLKMKYSIPCCRDVYYELYRKFFWLLNNTRN